jgi:RNA polymerase sigma-70 factor (ECF subfamily)
MSVQELAAEPIERKIERSSFGTPAARRRWQRTSPAAAQDILALVKDQDDWADRLAEASFHLEVLVWDVGSTEVEPTHSTGSWEQLLCITRLLQTHPDDDHLNEASTTWASLKAILEWAAPPASEGSARPGVAPDDATDTEPEDLVDLAAFYTRHMPTAQAACRRLVRDPEVVDDLVQEVFVEVLSRQLWKQMGRGQLRWWLLQRVRRMALDHLRDLHRHQRRTVPIPDDEDGSLADPVPGPEELVVQAEQRALVRAALEGLSTDDQQVLGLWMQEIGRQRLAEALEVPVALVDVRVHRARQRLLASLGALLVARHGPARCNELAGMLKDWDGHLQPVVRKRIVRHIQHCPHCGHLERLLTTPEQVL